MEWNAAHSLINNQQSSRRSHTSSLRNALITFERSNWQRTQQHILRCRVSPSICLICIDFSSVLRLSDAPNAQRSKPSKSFSIFFVCACDVSDVKRCSRTQECCSLWCRSPPARSDRRRWPRGPTCLSGAASASPLARLSRHVTFSVHRVD